MAREGGEAPENRMPDLAHLTRNRTLLRFRVLLTGDAGRSVEDRALLNNLARLVDRALVHYEATQEHFDTWVEEGTRGNFGALLRAAGTIEDCVTATRRSCSYATRLAGRGQLDPGVLPKTEDVTLVIAMRDAIQHTDERILGINNAKGKTERPPIEMGQHNFVQPENDAAVLGSHQLPWVTLANVLTALHIAVGDILGEPPPT